MNNYTTIAEFYNNLITEIVEFRGITKANYAFEIGVTPTALSRWTKGQSIPRKKHSDKIIKDHNKVDTCKILGIKFNESNILTW